MGPWTASFVQRLRELGWIEGRTIAIEVHWAEGRNERYTEIAAEFVRLKVAVIVTSSAAPVLAAKQATSVIPIVFAAAVDPLGSQLVESLARPGGNITGLSLQQTDAAGKRLELLRALLETDYQLLRVHPLARAFDTPRRRIRVDKKRGLLRVDIETNIEFSKCLFPLICA